MQKRGRQVRDEREKQDRKTAPVYTAVYKVNRSDVLMGLLLLNAILPVIT